MFLLSSAVIGNLLIAWTLVLSVLSFAFMGVDKAAAKLRKNRIRERSFWIASFAGGALGVVFGGIVFRHKVAKKGFWPPVLAAMLIWLAIFYFVFF